MQPGFSLSPSSICLRMRRVFRLCMRCICLYLYFLFNACADCGLCPFNSNLLSSYLNWLCFFSPSITLISLLRKVGIENGPQASWPQILLSCKTHFHDCCQCRQNGPTQYQSYILINEPSPLHTCARAHTRTCAHTHTCMPCKHARTHMHQSLGMGLDIHREPVKKQSSLNGCFRVFLPQVDWSLLEADLNS